MFGIEDALSQWKKSFLQQSLLAPDVAEEIEDYLREEIAMHQENGASPEIAFQKGLEKLGETSEMIVEYNKLKKTVAYRFTLSYLFHQWYDYFSKFPIFTTSSMLGLILLAVGLHAIFDYSLLTLPMIVFGHVILLIHVILLSAFAIAPFFLKKDVYFFGFFSKRNFVQAVKFAFINFLFIFICLLGLLFLLAPGLYLYYRFFVVRWLMVDQDLSSRKAIRLNHRWLSLFKGKLMVWTLAKGGVYLLIYYFLFRTMQGTPFLWVYMTVFYMFMITISRVFYQSLCQGYVLKEMT